MQVIQSVNKNKAVNDGDHGGIIGRNTFQRPKEQAVAMLSKIIGIYLGKS